MSLNENPSKIQWQHQHYIYIEKKGLFMQAAPAAWQELHQQGEFINSIEGVKTYTSLYQVEPEMIYRAGIFLAGKPKIIPPRFSYLFFDGGTYLRFELKGSYAQLPQACGRVFEIVEKNKVPVRKGFFIENYVNDPRVTPEPDLITEILVPIDNI